VENINPVKQRKWPIEIIVYKEIQRDEVYLEFKDFILHLNG